MTEVKYLRGFDYATYLKRHFLVGQVDPWRRTDEGKPLFALLVQLDYALAECKEWSKQDIGKVEFINYLKLNDILSIKNVDEFKKIKEELKKSKEEEILISKKKEITPERRKKLMLQVEKMNAAKQKVEKDSISEKSL